MTTPYVSSTMPTRCRAEIAVTVTDDRIRTPARVPRPRSISYKPASWFIGPRPLAPGIGEAVARVESMPARTSGVPDAVTCMIPMRSP
jgi:hypothetical protein